MRGTRLGVAAAIAVLAPSVAGAAECGSLTGKTFGAVTIVSAATVTPPLSLTSLGDLGPVKVNAPFCLARGVMWPSGDSYINFEVWLPPAASWNGRYLGTGNGGFAGSPIYGGMAWALEGGYAVSGTDTGHPASAIDARWAAGHPEKIVDFGWRAIHETATVSKAVIEAYYGKAASHSYFSGCSDGGREALMEAQRFPSDYNGIVAGAPANLWSNLLANTISTEQAEASDPNSWIPPEKLSAITDATLKACHGENGYLDDPSQCHFDPEVLLCKADASNACLTAPQVEALKKIYAGARDASGGSIFPGYPPSGEAGPAAWGLWITGGGPARSAVSLAHFFGTGFFANMVYGKQDWDFRSVTPAEAYAAAKAATGQAVDAPETDLGAFKAAGGKLLQYHGWNDFAIAAPSSINYYNAVADKMGGVDSIRSFYRLFMAPGMQHCGVGAGPNAVGGVFGLPPPSRDPEHDLVSALAHWVEDGAAPSEIIATLYKDNDPSKGVVAQRPWCAYPARASFSGQGERTAASAYTCAAGAK